MFSIKKAQTWKNMPWYNIFLRFSYDHPHLKISPTHGKTRFTNKSLVLRLTDQHILSWQFPTRRFADRIFGKHRKIYSKNKANIFVRFIWILLHVYGKFMEKICLKAPQHYSVSCWINNFSISLWERPKPPHFMLSGLSDVSLNPETTCFLSLETPGHIK